jgi:hypothetical protein
VTREEEGEGFSSATRGQRPAGNDSAATGAGGDAAAHRTTSKQGRGSRGWVGPPLQCRAAGSNSI